MNTLLERLVSWAQNEEMINQYFTDHGKDCNEAVKEIERLEARELEQSCQIERRLERERYLEERIERLTNICEYARNELRDTEAENKQLQARVDKLEAALTKNIAQHLDEVLLEMDDG